MAVLIAEVARCTHSVATATKSAQANLGCMLLVEMAYSSIVHTQLSKPGKIGNKHVLWSNTKLYPVMILAAARLLRCPGAGFNEHAG